MAHHRPIAIQFVTAAGCANCLKAQQAVVDTVNALQSEYPLELSEISLTDHPELLSQYEMWSTPALIINDELAFVGKVDEQQLREQLAGLAVGR